MLDLGMICKKNLLNSLVFHITDLLSENCKFIFLKLR